MTQSTESNKNKGAFGGFYKGVMFTSAGSIINIVFLFAETIVATRLIERDSYGVYILLITIVNFFVMVVDFGNRAAITQMLASSEGQDKETLANTAATFRLLVVVIFSILILLAQGLAGFVDDTGRLVTFVIYVPLMILFTSYDELLLGMLQGFQIYHHIAGAQIIRSILRFGLTILFLYSFQLGVLGLIISWTISYAVSSIYMLLMLPISRRINFDRDLLTKMLKFGLPLQMNRLLYFVSTQAHVLILGAFAGPASVALFSVASRVPQAVQRLSDSFTAVYFPTITNLLATGRSDQAGFMLNQSLRLLSFAFGCAALIAVLFSNEIMVLLFSARYQNSGLIFAVLMLSLHMGFLVSLMGFTLTSAGYPARSLGTDSIRTAISIVVDFLLIPTLGPMGPALANFLSGYIGNPINVQWLRMSEIRVVASPYVKQSLTLLACSTLFLWFSPTGYVFKVIVIVLFLGLNLALETVSFDDIQILLPAIRARTLRGNAQA